MIALELCKDSVTGVEGFQKQSGKCANDLNASKHSNHREEDMGPPSQGKEAVNAAQKHTRTTETKLLHKTKTDTTRYSQSVSQSVRKHDFGNILHTTGTTFYGPIVNERALRVRVYNCNSFGVGPQQKGLAL